MEKLRCLRLSYNFKQRTLYLAHNKSIAYFNYKAVSGDHAFLFSNIVSLVTLNFA